MVKILMHLFKNAESYRELFYLMTIKTTSRLQDIGGLFSLIISYVFINITLIYRKIINSLSICFLQEIAK